MRVSLTFDNGPAADTTGHVLDVLRERGIKATFFVVGQALAEAGGDRLTRRAEDDGHRIGNHSFTHSTPLGELNSPAQAIAEICDTEQLIDRLGHQSRLFRPFGGGGLIGRHLFHPSAWDYLAQAGYTCVLWNCLAYDWIDEHGWVEPTIERASRLEWPVIVLHDVLGTAMKRLEHFLDLLAGLDPEFRLDFPADCLPMVAGKAADWAESCIAVRG